MTTTFTDAARAAPLPFPPNVGVSSTAAALEGEMEDIEQVLLLTVTHGRRYSQTLHSLAEACESSAAENWDGYGACAIDPSSLSKAIWFSKLIPTRAALPEVTIDPDGEVRFEWYRGPRRVFAVTVRGNGELVYAGIFGASEIHGTEYLEDQLPPSFLANIDRVYA